MAREDDTLLNELCAICHTNVPKYRCPRCSLRTCSLQCVKRHKLRSQCPGTRDPGAYLRRAELATPAAFDQDFNFITSVERSLDRAAQNAGSRGVHVHQRPPGKLPKESTLDKETTARRVMVDKAPVGMSRSKQNKTRWDSRQNSLFWTVEWITHKDQKCLRTVLDTSRLSESYTMSMKPKTAQRHKRRKIEADVGGERDREKLPATIDDGHGSETVNGKTLSPHGLDAPSSDLYFYLHRPHTPSNIQCVIPLDADATLAVALRDRVVLEFPTIFVLPDPPTALPEGYITEAEFLQTHTPVAIPATEVHDGDLSLDAQEEPFISREATALRLDENEVLDVLKKDLGLNEAV